MTDIAADTDLIFVEIKRGGSNAKTYELTAGEFVNIVKNKDCCGELNVGVEPILDADGAVSDFTADKFYSLPISEQLDMCCRCEGDARATVITYKMKRSAA